MKELNWTIEKARSFMVGYHYLNTEEELKGHSGIKEIFNRLKSIQYDPLDVVGRNADLVIQARVSDYTRGMINEALYSERYLIDGWDKMMGIYETNDYPYLSKVRENRAMGEISTLKNRLQIDALNYTEPILELLKEKPLKSSEIKFGETSNHRWGQTKHSSATLDYLFHSGKIGIRNRVSTQKQYDLIENLLQKELLIDSNFSDDEFIEYYLLRRIKTMGLVWNKSGVHWSGPFIKTKKTRTTYLNILKEKELIKEVHIEGIKESFYILAEFENFNPILKEQLTIIAPLDNFIWDRALIKELFNFEYTWEVYTPVVKRKYGYYVLPLLYKNELVGRIEFEKHRLKEDLLVKSVWWESTHYEEALEQSIKQFNNYLIGGIE